MADCHDLFQIFYDKIKLPSSKKESLKQARDALRNRIKKYFNDELRYSSPKFWIQGSYVMGTIVNPLDGEYDIDDGVYLQNLDENKEKWPSTITVHNWIYKAVEGHTDKDPEDKRTCVRIIYSGRYHVDLPIYGNNKGKYYLAEKGKRGWSESDPKSLTEWFKSQVMEKSGQLRKIVQYLKAWADYKSSTNDKLPSGLLLTVLVANNYESRERDDSSFGGTVKNVYDRIINNFVVYNPLDSLENLAEQLNESQKRNFLNLLSNLLDSASKALKEDNKKKASEIWQKEFGDRFPIYDDSGEKKGLLFTPAPAILKDDARSA